MLNLVGGDAFLLEYDYFTGNSAVSTVTTSINCFVQFLVNRYANNPYVAFDFFNEPLPSTNPYMTYSNYRTVEQAYCNTMTSVIDVARAVNPNQVILVDMPQTNWYDFGNNAVPIDIPRNIIWNVHYYCGTGVYTLANWKSFMNWAVKGYVTTYGKPLFVGEYGYTDDSGVEGPAFVDAAGENWQTILSGQVAYMKTLPLWGYQWWSYDNLYGKANNVALTSEGYTVYSASDSTWILNTVLG
jgi:hypothetical protein